MKWKILSAFCVAGLAIASANEAHAQSSTVCSKRYNLAWEMPLQSSDVGRSVTDVLKRSEFHTVRNLFGDRNRVAIGRAPDNTVAVQMNIPKGENRTSTFFLDPLGKPGVDAACLSLRIFFENGFEWAKGGGGTKLGFGLWGGEPSKLSGGTPPHDQLGWSVRNVNSSYGFRLYSYHLNRSSGRFGQQGGSGLARWGSSDWRPGQWHDVELEVVMNDVGSSNGYTQLWLNGKHRQTMTNLRFRDKGQWAIRGLYFADIWGGTTSDPKHFSPKAQKMWYADYKIYKSGGSSAPSSSPSNSGPVASNPKEDVSSPSSGSFGAIAPKGTIGGPAVTTQWNPDARTQRYYVKVVNKRTKNTVFGGQASCKSSPCSLSVGSLPRGEYEWMVRPVYSSGAGNYSRLSFAIGDASAAAAPTPSETNVSSNQSQNGGGSFGAVAPQGAVDGKNLPVKWNPDAKTERYYVKVVDTRTKTTVFGGQASCKNGPCSLNIGSLSRGVYQWMVRPVYSSGPGDYSRLSFEVG